jgi:hypothetical protein
VRERVGEEDGETIFEVAPKGDEDLRAGIFRAAVDGDFVLLGLEKKGADLESVFRELTTGTQAEAS